MKFLNVGDGEWESEDWRWKVRQIEAKEFSLYEYDEEGSRFVGDFPSIDLAKQYATHVNECEVKGYA